MPRSAAFFSAVVALARRARRGARGAADRLHLGGEGGARGSGFGEAHGEVFRMSAGGQR